MRFLILVRGGERMASGPGHLELTDEMTRAGVYVAAERLADPTLARWVGERPGTGSPPAAEQLTGFYLVDCAGSDEAVGWAAKVPDAANTPVEVRPVLDMGGAEF
jgi:hypothetical protein